MHSASFPHPTPQGPAPAIVSAQVAGMTVGTQVPEALRLGSVCKAAHPGPFLTGPQLVGNGTP